MPARRPNRYWALRRKGRLPVWGQITWRVALVLAMIGLAILVHWLDRDGLRDNADGNVSFTDIIYFTMISITTTGYGDVAPVSTQARLFDALVVTPIRIFIVLIFVGTAFNFVFRRTWERWRMAVIQNNLNNHVVVVGYGTSGAEAVAELIVRGTDARCIVVIDQKEDALDHAEALGCAVLSADATRDKVLLAVQIDRARICIVSAGRDDTSILVTLTARHLAPSLPITVVVRNDDNELLARQAGATTVINPVSFAGLLMAGSAESEHITDYIGDLASQQGRVKLIERPVRAEECGRPLAELAGGLGVRVYRAGRAIGFWEEDARTLCEGDLIVEIVPTVRSEADRPSAILPPRD